jgi:hypothetical protein
LAVTASAAQVASAVQRMGRGVVVGPSADQLARALNLPMAPGFQPDTGALDRSLVARLPHAWAWGAPGQDRPDGGAPRGLDAGLAAPTAEASVERGSVAVVVRAPSGEVACAASATAAPGALRGQLGAVAVPGAALSAGDGVAAVALGDDAWLMQRSFAHTLRERGESSELRGYADGAAWARSQLERGVPSALAVVGRDGEVFWASSGAFVVTGRDAPPSAPPPSLVSASDDAGAPLLSPDAGAPGQVPP